MDKAKQLSEHSTFDELAPLDSIIEINGITTFEIINSARALGTEVVSKLSSRLSLSDRDTQTKLRNVQASLSRHGYHRKLLSSSAKRVPTGILTLDNVLCGGFQQGEITEVFGASGSGKSQLLLQVALKAQSEQNARHRVDPIFISTEAALETRRLCEMVGHDTQLQSKALERIFYAYCQDEEIQDHIILTQLPSKLHSAREWNRNGRLVIIDSIGHHFRSRNSFLNNLLYLRNYIGQQEAMLDEISAYSFVKTTFAKQTEKYFMGHTSFRNRSSKKLYLFSLYRSLSKLAKKYDVAFVLANQVSDRFDDACNDNLHDTTIELDPLAVAEQEGSYSGWNSFSPALRHTEHLQSDDAQGLRKRLKLEAVFSAPPLHRDPPKKIPSLGVLWARLSGTKVLLWKSYTSWEDNSRILRHLNMSSDADFSVKCNLSRQARVVSPFLRSHLDTHGFMISEKGLFESSEGPNVLARN